MKNSFSLLLLLLFIGFSASAQRETKIGAKLNYYFPQIPETTSFTATNIQGYNAVTINLAEAKQGGGFGIMAQIPFSKIFYIQPELLWDFHTIHYDVENVGLDNSTSSERLKETYYRVDVPVNIGVKLFGLKGFVGGIARFNMPGNSQFEDRYESYEQGFNMPSWGWHVGAGIDLGDTIIIDAKYEESISDFGSHFSFGTESFSLNAKERRLVFSVGIVF